MVVGTKFLLQTSISWCGCATLLFPTFAWMPYVGLQCLTIFLWQIRRSRNVPLAFWTLWLQLTRDVRHHILIMCERFFNACTSGSRVRAGNGVVHLVRAMRIILSPQWQVQFFLGWSKQFKPLQHRVPCIEILCPWVRPHRFCEEVMINSVHCSFQIHWCLVKSSTDAS